MPITAAQVARLRDQTQACETTVHFNNAGASLMPDPVYDSMIQHLALERRIGGYEAAAQAEEDLNRFYTGFGQLLGVRSEEIAFVENATRAWDMAFYSLPLEPGDRIISHESEYASNYLAFLHMAKKRGVEIDIAPSDEFGQIDVDALNGIIRPNTKLINLTHVPTQGGLVNPAEQVGKFANDNGLIFMLDACQSVGQMEIDVSQIGCHILSGTGRKYLRGPRGTGFLYISNQIAKTLDPPFIDLHAATWTGETSFELAPGARRFENWESNVAGRVGLATAVDYAMQIGLSEIEARVTHLSATLREQLADIPGVRIHDQGVKKCGIVTFDSTAETATELAVRLRTNNVNISVSRQESARLDFSQRSLTELARASVHYFNTETEIERFCELVRRG